MSSGARFGRDTGRMPHQPPAGFPRPRDAWYRMTLQPVRTRAANCPDDGSKVIAVDGRIIPDHGNIFTPAFLEYVVRTLNARAGAVPGE